MAPPDRSALAEGQAALRRVATLVATAAPAEDLFDEVAQAVATVLGVPRVTLNHHRSDGALVEVASAGIDVAGSTRARPAETSIEVPIVVAGQIWGDISVAARPADRLPAETEQRLHDFTELLGLAISNAESRDALQRLAVDQAALRRVATLVAEGAPADEVYAAVAQEAVDALDLKVAVLVRFDPGPTITVLASVNSDDGFPVGSRFPLDGGASKVIFETGRAARVDTFEGMSGTIAAAAQASGENSSFGVPIIVEASVWGMLAGDGVGPEPLPWDIEPRLRAYTELVATAISNTESRNELRRVAEEQAALRRVATLVAQAPASEELFSAVAHEVATVLNVPGVIVTRYEADGMAVVFGDAFESELSGAEAFFGVGSRAPADPGSLAAQVLETHGTARVDDFSTLVGTVGDLARAAGFGCGCASPSVVNGELWGKMCVFSGTGRRRRAACGDAFGSRKPHHCRRSALGRDIRPLSGLRASP